MDVTPHTKTANGVSQGGGADHRHEPAISAGKTGLAPVGAQAAAVIDPVCGMTVEPKTAKHQAEHDGHNFYFCSAGCRTKFLANPLQFLKPKSAAVEPVVEGTIYTCPMHPQIRQVGPGSCPICGMALEPETVTLDKTPNPELADMTRRFWIGVALTLPVFALAMGGHLTGLHTWLGQQTSNWVQLALATPVVLWAGWPFFVRGWQSLKTDRKSVV